MVRIVLVNPCRSSASTSGATPRPQGMATNLAGQRGGGGRQQPRSCLFVSLALIGLVVFGVTTLVVASLEALVEVKGPPSARVLSQGLLLIAWR